MVFKKYKLSELIIRKKEQVKLVADAKFKRITIRMNHKGVVLRDEELGSKIKSTMFKINGGDFVLSGIDARNGAFGIVPNELDGAIITNDFWCLTPNENLLDKHFFLFLTSTKFFDHICKISSDGTTQRIRLQKDKFFNFEISIPEIKYQKELVKKFNDIRIATINLKNEHNDQIALINQLRQAYLREAMQGELVSNETSDGKTGADLLHEIQAQKEKLIKEKKIKKSKPLPPISKEEIPFEIPKNWVWCRLGQIINLNSGQDLIPSEYNDKEKGIPYITGASNLQNEKVIINRWTEHARSIAYNGDLLLTCKGSGVGKTAMLEIEKAHIARQIMALSTISSPLGYVYIIIKNSVEDFRIKSKSLIPGIDRDTVLNVYTPLPPLEIQERINAKLNELMNYCDDLENSIKISQSYNEQLLQQVLREALEVKDGKDGKPQLGEEESQIYPMRKVINKNCDTGDMAILAGYIIKTLSTENSKDFGRVKLQKMLHLVEYHCQLSSELKYHKNVAGPYAWELEHVIEPKLKSLRFFDIKKDKFGATSKVTYTPLSGSNELSSLFCREFKNQAESINNLLDKFRDKNWEFCEMISTIYAVWNNRLINKELYSDDILKQDFLNWDDKKKRFIDQLDYALGWIRKEKIEPVGFGAYISKN
ncbi:restriction endonuclease subunit S [Chryseobacterium sp. AG363]|uniref:restriction endonuclease subunit S n=1 Tax=Chryseobacterium sp. AG363 TaxID=2183997 RepID=UPI000E72F0AE|nr:restriction endonuclease subunit S [Chryseobacterium sp. AG363]RKE80855.1 type I restriction enzyme S subunit [Chryseobacterium sp. AG363]